MASYSSFKIDGATMPTPAFEGVEISWNPVHSENTGRTADGTATGTVKGWKETQKIKFPPLTADQVAVIRSAVRNNTFKHSVTMTDLDGVERTLQMYVGAVGGTHYSWARGLRYITGLTLELIEC